MSKSTNSTQKENQNALNASKFYGAQCLKEFYSKSTSNDCRDKCEKNNERKLLPHRLNNLLGPTQIWQVFKKQTEALHYAKSKRNGIMTFAFQQWDGTRLFLVAHPKIFWHYDLQKNPAERCSYEIIPEASVCKLYFDIEFDLELNKNRNGFKVIEILIRVVLYFLSSLFSIEASKKDILNLDSSTNTKFSRHLIFLPKNYIFANNKVVGSFVHFICEKVKAYLNQDYSYHCNLNSSLECKCCKLSRSNACCVAQIGVSKQDLALLMVTDRQGKQILICDEAVYTKNRHFRLFQNTKWKKNSPLVLSVDNEYKPLLNEKEGNCKSDIFLEALFLDSLISHTRFLENEKRDLKIIHGSNSLSIDTLIKYHNEIKDFATQSNNVLKHSTQESPYPEVDHFINSIVFPGSIWRSAYFSTSSVIVYDIVGNRFCRNIGRQHRSNNIKFIVNLQEYTFYQKCHDPECSAYRSNPTPVPTELKFKLEDDTDLSLVESLCSVECDNSDSELMEVASVLEDIF